MDASPSTVQFPDRVYETYKDEPNLRDLKIILTIREPIARELSMYNHMLYMHKTQDNPIPWVKLVAHTNGTAKSFTEFVDTVTIPHLDDLEQVSSIAQYYRFLSDWFTVFSPDQILLLSYENDIKPGEPAKKRIQEFLRNPFPNSKRALSGPLPSYNVNDGDYKVKDIPCSVVDRLQPLLESFHQQLYDLIANTPRPTMEANPWPKFEPPRCVHTAKDINT